MKRQCDLLDCGVEYEAGTAKSRFHSPACRKRAHRGAPTRDASQEAPIVPLSVPDEPAMGPIEAAALKQLQDVERDQTLLGQAALALSRRLDRGGDTGAGMASLVKQLEATVKAATADVKSADSPLDRMRDELAQRRAQRGA